MTDQTAAYQLLTWDTNFFGFKVFKITEGRHSEEEFILILDELRSQQCTLAYWQAEPAIRTALEPTILSRGGSLVDLKTTFIRSLDSIAASDPEKDPVIVPYSPSMPESGMISLAIQSGLYSRFAVDSRIPKEKFESLYTTWILRSISRDIAEEVLVHFDGETICGMITLGNKDGRGDIGLVAVDEQSRGKNIGVKLVEAAMRWFKQHGYTTTQVVTQGQNLAACRLYEKCGYHVESSDPYYHIWL
jgi:dTDP-4-amino-4,6-dideoxy-D-galactose acyltransferase